MKILATLVLLIVCAAAHGQSIFFGLLGLKALNPACALPYTPTLSGTGPLPSCFVSPASGSLGTDTITQSGGTIIDAASSYGFAVMTGAGHPSSFSQTATIGGAGIVSGVCALAVSGNGYCYVSDGSQGAIALMVAGNALSGFTTSCPPTHTGDQMKLSISSANLLTCTNITTPGGGPVSLTDTTYLVGTLYPAMLVSIVAPLGSPSSTSP